MASVSARRAMPPIAGVVNRLCGLGHCQKKVTAMDPLPSPVIAHNNHQVLIPEVCVREEQQLQQEQGMTNMVLLGRPGAGKGTYGSQLAQLLNVPHISTGDLIREEMKKNNSLSKHITEVVSRGQLLGDDEVFDLLTLRLHEGAEKGEKGFILDGFPRTLNQAIVLDRVINIHMAVNFNQEREVLIQKCLGRRVCGECGRVFSLADVSQGGYRMPAILPPIECLDKMVTRKDDNEESIRRRLEIYDADSKPVEDFYRKQKKLVNFNVRGSINESWPKLLRTLHLKDENRSAHKQGSHLGDRILHCPRSN